MAYGAGAAQWPLEARRTALTSISSGDAPRETPKTAADPAQDASSPVPPAASASVRRRHVRPAPTPEPADDDGHVSVMEVKDETVNVPARLSPSAWIAQAQPRPAPATDKVQPLIHDDWDPDKDGMNWSLLSEDTSARLHKPLRAFVEEHGPRRALLGGALLLCLLGLGLLFEAECAIAIESF